MNEKIEWYREVLELEPNSKVFFPFARLLAENGDYSEAISILRHGLERHTEYLEARLFLIELLHKTGDACACESEISQLNKMFASYAGFWQAWAACLASEKGEADTASILRFLAARFVHGPLSMHEVLNRGLESILHSGKTETAAVIAPSRPEDSAAAPEAIHVQATPCDENMLPPDPEAFPADNESAGMHMTDHDMQDNAVSGDAHVNEDAEQPAACVMQPNLPAAEEPAAQASHDLPAPSDSLEEYCASTPEDDSLQTGNEQDADNIAIDAVSSGIEENEAAHAAKESLPELAPENLAPASEQLNTPENKEEAEPEAEQPEIMACEAIGDALPQMEELELSDGNMEDVPEPDAADIPADHPGDIQEDFNESLSGNVENCPPLFEDDRIAVASVGAEMQDDEEPELEPAVTENGESMAFCPDSENLSVEEGESLPSPEESADEISQVQMSSSSASALDQEELDDLDNLLDDQAMSGHKLVEAANMEAEADLAASESVRSVEENDEAEEHFSLRTRSMAEVLAEQGDLKGALDIYHELVAATEDSSEKKDLEQRITTLTGRLGQMADIEVDNKRPEASSKDKLISMLEALADRVEARAQ